MHNLPRISSQSVYAFQIQSVELRLFVTNRTLPRVTDMRNRSRDIRWIGVSLVETVHRGTDLGGLDCDENNRRKHRFLAGGGCTIPGIATELVSTDGNSPSVVRCPGHLLRGPQGVTVLGFEEMNLVDIDLGRRAQGMCSMLGLSWV